MSIKLPGKKVQALIIIILALFIGYFLYVINVRSLVLSLLTKSGSNQNSLDVVTAQDNSASNLDSDHDGLKDWQEARWGTDKNNPDTDGDGTPDGQEVAEGRDPLVKGPNDSLAITRGVATSSLKTLSQNTLSDPTNLSQNLSQNLFTGFMSLQNSNQLDDTSQTQLVNDSLSNIDLGAIPPKYGINDVNIVSVNSTNLRNYGNQLATLLSGFKDKVNANSSNEVTLAAYGTMINSIKKIPTPSSLTLTHVQILNDLNSSSVDVSYIISYGQDPLKGLLGLKMLQVNADALVPLFAHVATEMQKNAIIFTTNESGNIWNNY